MFKIPSGNQRGSFQPWLVTPEGIYLNDLERSKFDPCPYLKIVGLGTEGNMKVHIVGITM
jgi:hypothetical protein